MQAILIANMNAKPGRDDDYNDWYTNVHIRDAMRFKGSVAVQRFVAAEAQVMPGRPKYKYLALYEASDAELVMQEHFDAADTPRFVPTDASERSDPSDHHHYVLQFRANDPADRTPLGGAVILEQFNALSGREKPLVDWYNQTRIAGALTLPGIISCHFMKFLPIGQLFVRPPQHLFSAVYRTSNLVESIDAWRSHGLSEKVPIECCDIPGSRVVCYEPVIARLTKDDVLHASPQELAVEQRARAKAAASPPTPWKEWIKTV